MTDNGSPTDATSADQSAEKFPLRLRVHALARALELTSKQVLEHLQDMGVTARTAQSSISRSDAEAVERRVSGATEAPKDEPASAPADTAQAGSSLFSAVETPQPVAAPRQESAAPLFLPPSAVEAPSSVETPAAAGEVAEPAKTGPAKTGSGKAGSDKAGSDKAGADKAGTAEAEASQPESAPSDASDGDTEQAPAQRRQRRPAKKTAGKAKVAEASSDDAETAETPAKVDAEDASAEQADVPAESGDTESADDQEQRSDEGESRSRRRRRGRRGRGRGRGDQGSEGDDNGDEPSTDSDSSDNADASADETGDTDKAADNANQTANETATDADATDAGAAEGDESAASGDSDAGDTDDDASGPSSKRRRRRRRRRSGSDSDTEDISASDDPPNTVVHEREPRTKRVRDEVQGISGSTRLEAKRQRRRDGRDAGRRRPPILTESEFLARRESVERVMVVRERAANSSITSDPAHPGHTEDYTQIAVLEDGVLVEHFVTTETSQSMVGNIYLGRVQNVLPGMEAAFVDIGRGRNGVLYAGEVNWEAAGLDGGSRKIEQALKPGDQVLVQVSKDPIGHKGARLTTQISLAGRYLVYVPGGTSTGISRKLPDTERKRLKQILAKLVPEKAGVIIRTASEGVSAEELGADIERLEAQWQGIEAAAAEHKEKAAGTTKALYEEPDLLVRVVRDIFNEDFRKLVVEGDRAWSQVSGYVNDVAPDLAERLQEFQKDHADAPDSFTVHRIDEQLAKALDRKVWLPSGGTLIIEHTEAMTVVDVNTGKFTGAGGNLEETVTRNNLEAAEEIVRQMRLRDIGGMIIVDFIDMVLESNRDLVLRRLTEALARDRTRHQVSEVTSLGLVQMTRKRLGTGLLEAFSTTCTTCSGRGVIVHANPVEVRPAEDGSRGGNNDANSRRSRRSRRRGGESGTDSHSTDDSQSPDESHVEQKAPHKPAAEHPMFRAMAHDEHEAHSHAADSDDKLESTTNVDASAESATETASSEETTDNGGRSEQQRGGRNRNRSRGRNGGDRQRGDSQRGEADRGDTVRSERKGSAVEAPATAVSEPAAVQPPAESKHVAESKPVADAPTGAVVTRRRRAVRRAAAPTTAAEPVETVVSQTPVTTFAKQASEPVVEVKRSPRRRSGRRAAGPPPANE
ncbi:translation initiation factor IF-2 N-terminal domain-containing protein [Gordonia sp. (in: high G+C Gram-positive bacteria)]|uniref:translation initiation factor IF-2 N-terminal domain-containing protein n=1 Tax=Gordonia sp. (in: high G+C Gram-positive bacteria) TaxID=84139 RepID=UPI003C7210FC